MTRSRKIFLLGAALFVGFLAFTVYDISRRTTPPWKKGRDKEVARDTTKSNSSPQKATQQP